ncbi:unnamed protein product [Kuraishia capsulata CBS 1993]|uniref:Aminotransferase class I/classII large domain-containing protein n=1 Tax=Kuraishia capsulata CBS 1993 TaxID=1382522 RepID=W6MWW0_9ASCO|nr:uncharacterized protein KUCA_T00003930001 [Kuraishia capsulata CBS 1993]CDK27950.1 unnamed protein product [Kuraishia capsulata CBS 1993]
MVKQNPFVLEQFMDAHETGIEYNLGETCCSSLSIKELEILCGEPFPLHEIVEQKLAYTWIKGSDRLRDLVAGSYQGIGREDVVITNGAIGANFLTLYALVGPGDHVIVVDPAYEQLSSVPKMFGAEVSLLKLSADENYIPNVDKLDQLSQKNTKMIVINNPNNPTGSLIPTETMNAIVEIARKTDAYVLSDEVYRPLFHSIPDSDIPPSIVEIYDKGISTGSMSKAYALAGIRLGWVVSKSREAIEECLSRRDFNTISVSCVDDIIACYALKHKKSILKRNYELLLTNLQILQKFLDETKGQITCVLPKAGTTAFIRAETTASSMDFSLELIKKYNTLIVPGETFGYPGYFRIGFGNTKEDLVHGLENFKTLLKEKPKNT